MKLKYLYFRFYQYVSSIITWAASKKKQEVVSGNNSIYKIPQLLKQEQIQSVQIITTAGFIRRKSLEKFFEELSKEQIRYSVFSNVTPDPTIECVEQAVIHYQEAGCEGILAIGGGSVIDCAKIVGARIVKPKQSIRQMNGLMKIHKKLPLLYAVPTTAGTGSEVTAGAVITDTLDGVHYKFAIKDLCLIPKCAILDPVLTYELPPAITAVTGMDVLTHAVEAYTNLFASKLTKESAKKAVELTFDFLPIASAEGDNANAREAMLNASYLAGIAITNNYIGYVHALAHGIGGLYGVTHGKANAIILPVVLEEFGDCVEESLSELADVIGIEGKNNKEKTGSFISAIRELNTGLGIENKIIELKEADFPELIKRAMKESHPAYPVPEIWSEEKFKKVLYRLLP